MTFAEDASQIRRHRTPAVMSALRDLARATLRRSGMEPTSPAAGEPTRTPQPRSPSTGFHDQTGRTRLSPGPCRSPTGAASPTQWPDRLHPRLTTRSAWIDHTGELPIIEGSSPRWRARFCVIEGGVRRRDAV